MRGAELHNETLNPRSPKWTTTNQNNRGPCVTEMNTPCQDDANLETGGEETDLRRLPANASFNNVGCPKGRKNPHCLQGMTHTKQFPVR